jgi:hypothetical protein
MKRRPLYGVITFFPVVFPAKCKGIHAEDEEEAYSTEICSRNSEKMVPMSQFLHRPLCSAFKAEQRGCTLTSFLDK